MPIRVRCECGRLLQLADENLGKKVRCPVCKHVFTAQPPDAPAPQAVAVSPAREPDTLSFAPGDERSQDAPRRSAKAARLSEMEPIRRRRRVASSGRTPSGEWALTRFLDPGAVVALIAAGLMLFFSFKEMRLSQASKDVPQTMTLASLIQNGPGDNAHVILTDFFPTDNWVYHYQKSKYEVVNPTDAENRRWSNVWVPLIPMNQEQRNRLVQEMQTNPNALPAALSPRTVQVVVKLQRANDKASTTQWCLNQIQAPRLQGMVINLTDSLDSETKKLFQQSYPGTDFSHCWIIQEGKTPAGPGPVLAGIAGGTLLIVLAGLWFICRFLFRHG